MTSKATDPSSRQGEVAEGQRAFGPLPDCPHWKAMFLLAARVYSAAPPFRLTQPRRCGTEHEQAWGGALARDPDRKIAVEVREVLDEALRGIARQVGKLGGHAHLDAKVGRTSRRLVVEVPLRVLVHRGPERHHDATDAVAEFVAIARELAIDSGIAQPCGGTSPALDHVLHLATSLYSQQELGQPFVGPHRVPECS